MIAPWKRRPPVTDRTGEVQAARDATRADLAVARARRAASVPLSRRIERVHQVLAWEGTTNGFTTRWEQALHLRSNP